MICVVSGSQLSERTTLKDTRRSFIRDGVVALDSAVRPSELEALATVSDRRLRAVQRQLRAAGEDVFDGKRRFEDVQTRSPRRVDLRFSGTAHQRTVERFGAIAGADDLVTELLGDTRRCLVTGSIVSAPGARAQHWHRDGGQGLFPEQPLPTPPYALTVMAPVIGFGTEPGPPEFDLGAWLADDDDPSPAVAPAEPGVALVFDYRARHRGGANRSQTIRHYVYWVWARPWFVDHLNYFGPPIGADDGEMRL